MAFDYERREIRLLQGAIRKVAVSHTLSEAMIKMVDELATENLISRSEAIEIALFRFTESYNRKKKKDEGEALLKRDFVANELVYDPEFQKKMDEEAAKAGL
jgi:metal-responsive CopG/Arc/MetJ family transcriptional regulator